jgi:putative ABC transport system permease protein
VDGDVGPLGVLASLSLVAIAALISARLRLGLEIAIGGAAVRAAVQLLLVGAALGLVIGADQPLAWSWLWVAGILLIASWVVRRRAPELPGVFWLALAANVVTAALAAGLVFGLGVFPLEGRTLIPVMGMTIGNALTATVVAATLLVREVGERRDDVEARLALGQPWREAARPHLRGVLRAAISPQIERTRHVGTVFLPGAMVGLILAGVEPLDAVMVQGALMYVILGSVATSTTVITLGGARRLFTRDHRLLPLARATGPPPEERILRKALALARRARPGRPAG